MTSLFLGAREVGPGQPCFVIAEAGVNHNGNLNLALRLVEVAAAAGADAVKFQTFSADRVAAPSAPTAPYQAAHTGEQSQQEMLRQLELSRDDHRALQAHARRHGILFFSTPFDESSADLLDELGVCAFKVSSGDVTNLPFLAHLAGKGRPVILSTGMSELAEVGAAVETIRKAGDGGLALLHCVSLYPTDPALCNLRAVQTLASAFNVPCGFSDHTPGIAVALAAVALGACLIEKHLTLDRGLPGPDHHASLQPEELGELMRGIRVVQSALGDGVKRALPEEAHHRQLGRKSLHWARPLPRGTAIAPGDLIALRPATGIPPVQKADLLGRRLMRDVQAGDLVRQDDLAAAFPLALPGPDGSRRAVAG
jgi:N-acetylneuraminate synthase